MAAAVAMVSNADRRGQLPYSELPTPFADWIGKSTLLVLAICGFSQGAFDPSYIGSATKCSRPTTHHASAQC